MSIGIFWYWKNLFIGISHNFNVEDADSLGLIDSPYTHIEYWHELQKNILNYPSMSMQKLQEVKLFLRKKVIYLDETMLYKSKVDKIYSFFETSKEKSKLQKDSHYKI